MKKLIILMSMCLFVSWSFSYAFAQVDSKTKPSESYSKYSVDVTVTDIPKGQQTLFIPIKIDTMVLDFDKVALEGLATQNILAVASTSMDKVGTGIGLLKLDNNGLPQTLTLKALLKPVGQGTTAVSLQMVANEAALPSKGAVLNEDIVVDTTSNSDLEVTEKIEGSKKRLILSENKLTLSIKRPVQKEESIFIPVIFDNGIVDLDETFGHAVVGPGIAAKSFSSSSLHEGGPGIEILLTEVAEKDFTVDVDLIPRKIGNVKLTTAFPQKGHTAIVRGPQVEISPATINVSNIVVSN